MPHRQSPDKMVERACRQHELGKQADPTIQARVRDTIAAHDAAKKPPMTTQSSSEASDPLTGEDDYGGALFI